jgi:hypothetical protein
MMRIRSQGIVSLNYPPSLPLPVDTIATAHLHPHCLQHVPVGIFVVLGYCDVDGPGTDRPWFGYCQCAILGNKFVCLFNSHCLSTVYEGSLFWGRGTGSNDEDWFGRNVGVDSKLQCRNEFISVC